MTRESNRRQFLKTLGGVGVGLSAARVARAARPPQPMETLRIGLIGVGARGGGHLRRLLLLDGVEVKAVADIDEPMTREHLDYCEAQGHPRPDAYTRGEYDYRRMLEREDLDAAIISTPWRWHAPMALDAMSAGKHALIEVPAAVTLDECWQLVEAHERTGLHCTMMENVCYGREELMVLNMCRKGLFGELTHGEGAYIHDLREQLLEVDRGTGSWRTGHHERRNGNLYPTHGLGPIAQYMDINRGDRFDYLTSMSSPALGRTVYASEHFPPDHPRNRARYISGDMNTSLIKTARGRTIMVQWDTATPRPYSRLNLIQGTRGMFGGYPNRITVEGRGDTHAWQELDGYRDEFEHPLWKRVGEEAARVGGHGGMDFVMLWRFAYCLRNALPMDQDVYDAAAWSAIAPCSEISVANRARPVDIPDFTRGQWEVREPLGVVS